MKIAIIIITNIIVLGAAVFFVFMMFGSFPVYKPGQLALRDSAEGFLTPPPQHGVRPGTATLALRSIVQFSPVWSIPIANFMLATRPLAILAVLILLALVAAYLTLLLDAACAMFHPRGRSLHDYVFKTRVVLATR